MEKRSYTGTKLRCMRRSFFEFQKPSFSIDREIFFIETGLFSIPPMESLWTLKSDEKYHFSAE